MLYLRVMTKRLFLLTYKDQVLTIYKINRKSNKQLLIILRSKWRLTFSFIYFQLIRDGKGPNFQTI